MEKIKQECPQELKELLRDELSNYAASMPMTAEERIRLNNWVCGGNSPYCNPWHIADESGVEMSYLEGVRTLTALAEDNE